MYDTTTPEQTPKLAASLKQTPTNSLVTSYSSVTTLSGSYISRCSSFSSVLSTSSAEAHLPPASKLYSKCTLRLRDPEAEKEFSHVRVRKPFK